MNEGRRIASAAAAALLLGVAMTALLGGMQSGGVIRNLQIASLWILGACVIFGIAGMIMVRMAGWSEPEGEEDFDLLIERAEELARTPSRAFQETPGLAGGLDPLALSPLGDEDFEALVLDAMDRLPEEMRAALGSVAVTISDAGHQRHAYGLYHGGTVARNDHPDRIIIYRDTLLRDFGHDPDLLAAQVEQTLYHEVAHHLGWDERGVQGLGL